MAIVQNLSICIGIIIVLLINTFLISVLCN
jgi:hypothetical protein